MKIWRELEAPARRAEETHHAWPARSGWVVAGFSWNELLALGEVGVRGLAIAYVDSLEHLTAGDVDVMAVLSPETAPLFPASAGSLFRGARPRESWLSVLLPWQEPPSRSIRCDGDVGSFCCSAEVFASAWRGVRPGPVEKFCLQVLEQVLNGAIEVESFRIRQLPFESGYEDISEPERDMALIMAHRGPQNYLSTALRFLQRAAGASKLALRVGLDVEDTAAYQQMVADFPGVEFFGIDGAPVGPYVIRQALVSRTHEHRLLFHDSDDISCYDRLTCLAREMEARQVEVVGSHELRVDVIERTVRAYRFPLDSTAALALPGSTEENYYGCEPLLHPTLMMDRDGFNRAGGFSTDQRIANDTQFMLRSYFTLRMRNVDAFLYVRRRHAGALTVAKETALGIPLRRQLGSTWGAAFEAVKSGKAKLEDTCLMPRHSAVPHSLTRLSPGK